MQVNIVTKEDLEALKLDLLNELKKIITEKNSPPVRWLRTKDVCAMLNISQSSIQNYRAKGLLKPHKVSGSIYYDYEEIEKLLQHGHTKI